MNKKSAFCGGLFLLLRSAIVKILFGFSYEQLAFHLVDSMSLSWFCRIGIADKGFKKSALNKNINSISADTWNTINTDLLGYAEAKNIEKGRKVRIDCTCVESNIHHPTDSTLLWDAVRVLTRLSSAAGLMQLQSLAFITTAGWPSAGRWPYSTPRGKMRAKRQILI